ncbi:MAG TPA: hypothetical protein VFT31_00035 [Kribbella sp.]|nr:hypothetical protein [Kribbella sp.]
MSDDELPDDVEQYYAGLAGCREWPPATLAAIRATVELIRDLDRGTAPRTYGAAGDDGTAWDDPGLVAHGLTSQIRRIARDRTPELDSSTRGSTGRRTGCSRSETFRRALDDVWQTRRAMKNYRVIIS